MRLALRCCLIALLLSGSVLQAWAQDVAPTVEEPPKAEPAKLEMAESADSSKEEASLPAVTKMIARLKLSGAPAEAPAAGGLFAELGPSLETIVGRIDKAAKDDRVAGLWLEIRTTELGVAALYELRAAVQRFRATGKFVLADLRDTTGSVYALATACNEIVLSPQASLLIPGTRAEVMFYKGLFEKLGIKADFLQVGKYKGAAEPYSQEAMSPALREELDVLLKERFEQWVNLIAGDRKMEPQRVRALVDEGLFSAPRAVEMGLVDFVGYEDRVRQRLRIGVQAAKIDVISRYGQKKLDTDFSGMTGFFKMMDMLAGVEPRKSSSKGPKLALIHAVGSIVNTEDQGGLMSGGELITPDRLVKAIQTADKDEKIKAIVLRIDSPGGSALASDLIWKAVTECSKPVIASMGDVAASGGYYIAMGADEILATPGTVTGSIGVVGGKLAMGGLYEKLGLKVEVLSQGANSSLLSSLNGFSPTERSVWQRNMDEVYSQFIGKAAEGRGLTLEQIQEVAQGRIWTGSSALKHKLINRVGTLHDAIAVAKEKGGIPADAETDIVHLPEPANFFDQLLGLEEPSAQIRWQGMAGPVAAPVVELQGKLNTLQQVFKNKIALITPFELQIID